MASVSPAAAGESETREVGELVAEPTGPAQSAFDDVQRTLEQVDDFLETVVDLMETVSKLTGEGEEAGGD